MPLPASNATWPPSQLAEITPKYAEWSAWYSNDTDALANIYGGTNKNRPSDGGGILAKVTRWFWGRKNNDLTQPLKKLHVPVASDICQASADLLFSEPPTVTINDDSNKENQKAGERLALIADSSFQQTMVDAAEISAALGGVYLRAIVDQSVENHAFITKVDADGAIPEFRWGRLVAVTFWQVVKQDGQRVVRHLEKHELDSNRDGVIYHGLYDGSADNLGQPIPLADHPTTAGLAQWVDEESKMSTLTPGLAVEYAPNLGPNRRWRNHTLGAHLGRSDLDGIEPLMDAFDETWSSWMRDLEQGKGRLIVPQSMLQNHGPGQGAGFDQDQSVFTPVNSAPGSVADAKMAIEKVQFDIRVEQHERTAAALFKAIIRNAGYSAGTFGDDDDGAQMTATEVAAKTSRSYMTRDRKIRSLQPAGERILAKALAMDAETFSTGVPAGLKVQLTFGDAVQESQEALARTAQMLATAQAASIRTRVRIVHQDWTEQQVDDEVKLIMAENELAPLADPDERPPGAELVPRE